MLPLRVPVSIAVLLVALTTSGCSTTTATTAPTVTTPQATNTNGPTNPETTTPTAQASTAAPALWAPNTPTPLEKINFDEADLPVPCANKPDRTYKFHNGAADLGRGVHAIIQDHPDDEVPKSSFTAADPIRYTRVVVMACGAARTGTDHLLVFTDDPKAGATLLGTADPDIPGYIDSIYISPYDGTVSVRTRSMSLKATAGTPDLAWETVWDLKKNRLTFLTAGGMLLKDAGFNDPTAAASQLISPLACEQLKRMRDELSSLQQLLNEQHKEYDSMVAEFGEPWHYTPEASQQRWATMRTQSAWFAASSALRRVSNACHPG